MRRAKNNKNAVQWKRQNSLNQVNNNCVPSYRKQDGGSGGGHPVILVSNKVSPENTFYQCTVCATILRLL